MNNQKKTLVIGASPNSDRYAYKATTKLIKFGHPVELLGVKKGVISGVEIQNDLKPFQDIDTVTLYIGSSNQSLYYNYVISLNPNRVIFNPGTENKEFEDLLIAAGIEVVQDCTLVMLSMGYY